jgi:hypothetical protein
MLALAALVVAASLPQHGVLVPGQELGGVRLGDSPADVRARLGSNHGTCRGCARTTWYFTYEAFTQPGLGVEFRNGGVDAVFTIWSPPGWRTRDGLTLGAPAKSVPPLQVVPCRRYRALVARVPDAVTAYYVANGKLWGFGLLGPRAAVCR